MSSISKQLSNVREDYDRYSTNSLLKDVVLPKAFDTTNLYEEQFLYESLKLDYSNYLLNKEKLNIAIPEVDFKILDNINPVDNILVDYEQYCLTKGSIKDYSNEINVLDEQKIQVEQDLSKIKICPTCGKEL